ncbi:MAG: protein kinase [Gemmatimonadales bacterium]|nr:protein kinase [Gemmatimonadales bacterium]MBP7621820.1 protein kinase [Gemmatimonadales bacterium]
MSDRYRLERELGQGGMATVYLAEDLKHQRKVAVKVLQPELAAVIGAERFLSEIKTTANLQHPHILPLFDSGEAIVPPIIDDRSSIIDRQSQSYLYYVMPYVDGETLRSRLVRETQLSVNEAVRLATEIAGALDYAHSHGVIHRDIKPENILIQHGSALVADFGIALAVQQAGGDRMTQTGMSLGTPHYMSPEQAMGEKQIDARSDIYALGVICYEMLIGEPPFTGPSAQAIVAKVMTESPREITAQRKSVPLNVASAVAKSLEKLPADRFESAKAFATALADQSFATTQVHGTARGRGGIPRPLFGATAAIAALAIAAAAWGWLRPATSDAVTRQRVMLWDHPWGEFLSPGNPMVATQTAIAPDGSSIVFSDSVGGRPQLMRKLRDQAEPTPLAGTERGLSPFFSPDGAWIGFLTTDGKLKKIPVAGGGAITLSESGNDVYYVGVWLDDNTIVFVDDRNGLQRISAEGGVGTMVSSDSGRGRTIVVAMAPLPKSRGFLYTSCPGNCVGGSSVSVFDLAADTARTLVANAAGAWYSPTGHLLYTDRAGGLFANGFDLKTLALTGGAVPVIDGVNPNSFAMSATGEALYTVGGSAGAGSALMWVERDGRTTPVDSSWQGNFQYPTISPDGQAFTVSVVDGATHLWLRRGDGTKQKLTQNGSINWRASWSPDGRSIAFVTNPRSSGDRDATDIYQMPIDGNTPPTLLHKHSYGLWEAELSRDGEWLVYRSDEADAQTAIRARRLRGDTATIPLVVAGSSSMQAALSPDTRWLAYIAETTGQREVYLMAFPSGDVTRLVSTGGGSEPRWSSDGRELFYKSANNLMSVAVTTAPTLTLGTPQRLFSVAGYRGARNRQQYDVTPDGQRFLMIRLLQDGTPPEAVYAEHWLTELRTKLQAKGKP